MLWSPGTGDAMRRFSGVAAGSVSIVTGNATIAEISYSAATVNSGIGAVTDINNPATTGGWTTLVSLTGGPLMVASVKATQDKYKIAGIGREISDTGVALRMQILIDGVVVADLLASGTLALTEDAAIHALPLAVDGSGVRQGYHPLYCEDSFMVLAARVGTTARTATTVYVAAINYATMERG